VGRFQLGAESAEVPLPVLEARCAAASHVRVDMLGTSTEGTLLAIRGELVAIPPEAPPKPVLAETLAAPKDASIELGAARSPNGGVVALPTSRGLLVATLKGEARAAAAKLWTTPALDGGTACVPNDTADRIACAVKGAVAIYDAK
jgi:hypothetical protein